MKIALIVNSQKQGAVETTKNIIDLLVSENASVMMLKDSLSEVIQNVTLFDSHDELAKECDVMLTVGGDGTIIHSAKHASAYSKPVLGINLGRLGYVAELETDELYMLSDLVKGNFTTESRSILNVCVINSDGKRREYIVINDAVISRGSLSRIIDLQVEIDGDFASAYRADGLLVATPTGSTAYALSAGGPVISPELKCIELVPICPHSMSARSMILCEKSVISIKATSPDGRSYLTIDGQISIELFENDTVEIKNSSCTLDMVVLKKRNFFRLASEKLKEVN